MQMKILFISPLNGGQYWKAVSIRSDCCGGGRGQCMCLKHGSSPPSTPIEPMSAQFLFLIVMIKPCFLRLCLGSEIPNPTLRAHFWPLLMVSGERIDYRIKISVPVPWSWEKQYDVIKRKKKASGGLRCPWSHTVQMWFPAQPFICSIHSF